MGSGTVITLDGRLLEVMLLHRKGYCCSQIMAFLMLRDRGTTDPDLVRAMGGLCDGIGGSGDLCGTLAGGACLLSLCAGKGSDDEVADNRLPLMYSELTDWFRRRTGSFGGIRCDDILAGSPDKRACIGLITETYEQVLAILKAHGLGPKRREVG